MLLDMAYRLRQPVSAVAPDNAQPELSSAQLRPSLAPDRLVPAADILAKRDTVPAVAGIYGWWFDMPLPGKSLDATLQHGSHHLLYVGIALRKPSAACVASQSNLRKRITRNHLGNRIGSSIMRRSLAHLLKAQLGLTIERVGKKDVMPKEQERFLTKWMEAYAALTYIAHPSAWKVEENLIGRREPALPQYVRGSNAPTAYNLKRSRALANAFSIDGMDASCSRRRCAP